MLMLIHLFLAEVSPRFTTVTDGSVGGIDNSSARLPATELPQQLKGSSNFMEVYSFIGSVFDPGIEGHVWKLKEINPINFETVGIKTLLRAILFSRPSNAKSFVNNTIA
ncbi:hypothetical protein Droror1_Dr00005011 [Drosera rotundifolia]